jgi:hypothetical protein
VEQINLPYRNLGRSGGQLLSTAYALSPQNWTTSQAEMRPLEDENSKQKKLVADLSLDREMLQYVIRRKL